jgi:hypothetical protein
VWLILLAIGIGAPLARWMLALHGFTISGLTITFPGLVDAALLLVVTFAAGYFFGFVLAKAWNWTVTRK